MREERPCNKAEADAASCRFADAPRWPVAATILTRVKATAVDRSDGALGGEQREHPEQVFFAQQRHGILLRFVKHPNHWREANGSAARRLKDRSAWSPVEEDLFCPPTAFKGAATEPRITSAGWWLRWRVPTPVVVSAGSGAGAAKRALRRPTSRTSDGSYGIARSRPVAIGH